MEFKFKTKFVSKARCLIAEEKDRFLATASLSELKNIIPAEVIGAGKQDLLPIAGNLALINACNLNDDAMSGETALKVYKTVLNKYINTEHNRELVCGHIVSVGFSKYNSNYALGVGSEILKEEDIKNLLEPFNLAYAGVIYRLVCPKLAEEVVASNDPTSAKYLSVSSSWEVGFQEYSIAIGSQYLSDAQIFTPENPEFQELDKVLKCNGGSGTKDGQFVYRVLAGEPIFLGAGLTYTPASAVKGLTTVEDNEEIELDEEDANQNSSLELTVNFTKVGELAKNATDSLELISHSIQTTVTEVSNSNVKFMDKITEISQITDETLKVVKASAIHDFVQSEILKKNDEWKTKQSEAETKANELKAQNDTLAAQQKTISEQLKAVEEELKKFKDESVAREKVEKFSVRMASFDEAFDLTDEDRAIIKEQISEISDEAYTKVEAQLKVLLKPKTKNKTSVASVQPTPAPAPTPAAVVDAALSNGQPVPSPIPNATNPSDKDAFVTRFNNAFKLGETVKFQRGNR
jgi:hypothetical protein